MWLAIFILYAYNKLGQIKRKQYEICAIRDGKYTKPPRHVFKEETRAPNEKPLCQL